MPEKEIDKQRNHNEEDNKQQPATGKIKIHEPGNANKI